MYLECCGSTADLSSNSLDCFTLLDGRTSVPDGCPCPLECAGCFLPNHLHCLTLPNKQKERRGREEGEIECGREEKIRGQESEGEGKEREKFSGEEVRIGAAGEGVGRQTL